MKKLLIPIMTIAIFIAFYEQNSPNPIVIITIICMAIFMFGLMKLSAKIPPKNEDDEHKTI